MNNEFRGQSKFEDRFRADSYQDSWGESSQSFNEAKVDDFGLLNSRSLSDYQSGSLLFQSSERNKLMQKPPSTNNFSSYGFNNEQPQQSYLDPFNPPSLNLNLAMFNERENVKSLSTPPLPPPGFNFSQPPLGMPMLLPPGLSSSSSSATSNPNNFSSFYSNDNNRNGFNNNT
jgi:hypothetical protein